MFVFLYQVSLVLVAIQNEALTQELDGHGLYVDYHGEYAGAYDNYAPRPYSFEYGVSDPHTGDHKHHWEMKDEAGVVRGSYSLLESDGSTRTVDYVADHSGFRAVVKKIGNHGKVYSIENHGSVPSHSPTQTSLHETEEGISQQHIITEESPVEHIPLYQSYNGEIKNYQKYASEVQEQLPHSENYYFENPAENTYHESKSDIDEIHGPEQLGVEQNAFPEHQIIFNPKEVNELEQPAVEQNTFSEQQIIFNPKGDNSFNEHSLLAIVLPKTVETYHQHQAVHEAKLYEQPLKSNTEWLQYNTPIRINNENSYQNDDQINEVYYSNKPQTSWGSLTTHHDQVERQPHISLDSRSHESIVVIHPHGESSQRFYGQTGNKDDDSQYTD